MNDEMSSREFENYVGLLGRMLRLRTSQREAIADELQAHLEERFAALTEQGVGPQEAISMALAEFGDAAALAAQFSSVARLQRRRWMMRVGITSAVSVMLAVAVVVSTWPDASGRLSGATAQAQQPGEKQETLPAFAEPETTMNTETLAKLQEIGSATFNEVAIGEALDQLAKLGKFQIYKDQKALEEHGVAQDTLVTINLHDVPIEMLLRKMLEPLELTYMLDHGVMIITSCEVEESHQEVRVYRVDDLVRLFDQTQTRDKTPQAKANASEDAIARQMRAAGAPTLSDNPDMNALMVVILSMIEPESWGINGGKGAVMEYRGTLVVTQTTRNQMKIEKLLKDIRQTLPVGTSTAGGAVYHVPVALMQQHSVGSTPGAKGGSAASNTSVQSTQGVGMF